jgi:hypothetical protein
MIASGLVETKAYLRSFGYKDDALGGRSMASTDDVLNLLNDVNRVTLKRMEDKLDAMNAVTLKRMEDKEEQHFKLNHARLQRVEDQLGLHPMAGTPGAEPLPPGVGTRG